MANLVIDGLTMEQAKELASWVTSQGPRNWRIWFEHRDEDAPEVHSAKPFRVDNTEESVTIFCH